MKTAYQIGLEDGAEWIGPHGDGSLGNLSVEFIRFRAKQEFGKDADEYLRGFYAGLDAQ